MTAWTSTGRHRRHQGAARRARCHGGKHRAHRHPIAAKFSSPSPTPSVRKHYGLRDDQPVLLILGGGFGMGPVAEILHELDKVAGQFQTIVVAGRNEKLRRELATHNRKHPTHVLGFARTCTS